MFYFFNIFRVKYSQFRETYNSLYWGLFSVLLSVGSTLERLVLKNAAQRTSQRVKWTSGAKVSIFFLVGRTSATAQILAIVVLPLRYVVFVSVLTFVRSA